MDIGGRALSKTRTTIYIEDDVLQKFQIYKIQTETNFSELVNKLLREHLENPFNWDNLELCAFVNNIEGEE